MKRTLILAGFSVAFALAYGSGKVPAYSQILSFVPGIGNVMEMTVNASAPEQSHPQATTDLVAGEWGPVAHSSDGASAFVETNLSYSTASDTNVVIYLQADENAKFFRIAQ